MSTITKISYDAGGLFMVGTYDPNTGHQADVYAIDMVTQFAIDAAFERRVSVDLTIDDTANIVVVKSEPALDDGGPPPPAVVITRISTGVQVGRLVAEVFHKQSPNDSEKQGSTKDPVMLLLCHSAYAANHDVVLTLDDAGDIRRVVKGLPPLLDMPS